MQVHYVIVWILNFYNNNNTSTSSIHACVIIANTGCNIRFLLIPKLNRILNINCSSEIWVYCFTYRHKTVGNAIEVETNFLFREKELSGMKWKNKRLTEINFLRSKLQKPQLIRGAKFSIIKTICEKYDLLICQPSVKDIKYTQYKRKYKRTNE